MPHRFKGARRASRPQPPSFNTHSDHPFATCSSQSDLTTSSDDMDHFKTPLKRPGPRNPRPMKQSDVRQASRKTQMAWKGEVAGRIIPITNPVDQFLYHFVPGDKPSKMIAHAAFDMPQNAEKESDLYQPLVSTLYPSVLTSLSFLQVRRLHKASGKVLEAQQTRIQESRPRPNQVPIQDLRVRTPCYPPRYHRVLSREELLRREAS